jgi:hypothetical protein
MRCSETREPSLMAHNFQTKVYALLRDAFKGSRVLSSISIGEGVQSTTSAG